MPIYHYIFSPAVPILCIFRDERHPISFSICQQHKSLYCRYIYYEIHRDLIFSYVQWTLRRSTMRCAPTSKSLIYRAPCGSASSEVILMETLPGREYIVVTPLCGYKDIHICVWIWIIIC